MVRNPNGVMQAIPIALVQQVLARTIPLLERKVDEAVVAKPEAIDMVMSAVQIIDSAGLNWILSVQSRLETMGIKLRLVDPSAIITDVLMATRLDSRLIIEHTTSDSNGAGGADGR